MPDGDEIKVSFAAVEEAGSNIKSGFQKMTDELDTLKAKLAPIREIYQGESRDKWDAVMQQWEKDQGELNQVLASIGTAVAQAAEDYRHTEKSVGGLWG
jgi:early secretory antigenic target protein ESAT-6